MASIMLNRSHRLPSALYRFNSSELRSRMRYGALQTGQCGLALCVCWYVVTHSRRHCKEGQLSYKSKCMLFLVLSFCQTQLHATGAPPTRSGEREREPDAPESERSTCNRKRGPSSTQYPLRPLHPGKSSTS